MSTTEGRGQKGRLSEFEIEDKRRERGKGIHIPREGMGMIFGDTPPHHTSCGTKKLSRPLPSRGGGFDIFPARRQHSGGGVMSDSIHIFRQRKIWIPFSSQTSFASLRPDFHAPRPGKPKYALFLRKLPEPSRIGERERAASNNAYFLK